MASTRLRPGKLFLMTSLLWVDPSGACVEGSFTARAGSLRICERHGDGETAFDRGPTHGAVTDCLTELAGDEALMTDLKTITGRSLDEETTFAYREISQQRYRATLTAATPRAQAALDRLSERLNTFYGHDAVLEYHARRARVAADHRPVPHPLITLDRWAERNRFALATLNDECPKRPRYDTELNVVEVVTETGRQVVLPIAVVVLDEARTHARVTYLDREGFTTREIRQTALGLEWTLSGRRAVVLALNAAPVEDALRSRDPREPRGDACVLADWGRPKTRARR